MLFNGDEDPGHADPTAPAAAHAAARASPSRQSLDDDGECGVPLERVKVVSAAAGAQHTVLCDARGGVWVFGGGSGVGDANAGAWVGPSRVRGLPSVVVGLR